MSRPNDMGTPNTDETVTGRSQIFFLLALVVLAADKVGSIVVIGPLAEIIAVDLHLSSTQLGLLTSIPVLSFGIMSIFAPHLGRRYGLEVTLLIMLFLSAFGQGLRSTGFL